MYCNSVCNCKVTPISQIRYQEKISIFYTGKYRINSHLYSGKYRAYIVNTVS